MECFHKIAFAAFRLALLCATRMLLALRLDGDDGTGGGGTRAQKIFGPRCSNKSNSCDIIYCLAVCGLGRLSIRWRVCVFVRCVRLCVCVCCCYRCRSTSVQMSAKLCEWKSLWLCAKTKLNKTSSTSKINRFEWPATDWPNCVSWVDCKSRIQTKLLPRNATHVRQAPVSQEWINLFVFLFPTSKHANTWFPFIYVSSVQFTFILLRSSARIDGAYNEPNYIRPSAGYSSEFTCIIHIYTSIENHSE